MMSLLRWSLSRLVIKFNERFISFRDFMLCQAHFLPRLNEQLQKSVLGRREDRDRCCASGLNPLASAPERFDLCSQGAENPGPAPMQSAKAFLSSFILAARKTPPFRAGM